MGGYAINEIPIIGYFIAVYVSLLLFGRVGYGFSHIFRNLCII